MLKKQQGFTLTEGVIALAVVGLIAAFTLPQIINSTNEDGQIAKWKVGYQAVADIFDLYMTEDPDTRPTFPNYFFSKVRALKKCPTGGITQGCLPAGYAFGNRPAVILEQGVTITLNDLTNGVFAIQVDGNGQDAPNLETEDILTFITNTGSASFANTEGGVGATVLPGAIDSLYTLNSTGTDKQNAYLLVEQVMKAR